MHPLVGFEGRVTITAAGIDDFDPVVRVVDEDGGVVAENDDFDGRNSLVTFVLSPADRFDVEVREFSGDPGFYSVLLQRGDGENGAPPVLGEALERGQPVEGEVGQEQAALHDFTGDGEEIVVTVDGLLGFDPVVRVVSAGRRRARRERRRRRAATPGSSSPSPTSRPSPSRSPATAADPASTACS